MSVYVAYVGQLDAGVDADALCRVDAEAVVGVAGVQAADDLLDARGGGLVGVRLPGR